MPHGIYHAFYSNPALQSVVMFTSFVCLALKGQILSIFHVDSILFHFIQYFQPKFIFNVKTKINSQIPICLPHSVQWNPISFITCYFLDFRWSVLLHQLICCPGIMWMSRASDVLPFTLLKGHRPNPGLCQSSQACFSSNSFDKYLGVDHKSQSKTCMSEIWTLICVIAPGGLAHLSGCYVRFAQEIMDVVLFIKSFNELLLLSSHISQWHSAAREDTFAWASSLPP